MPPKPQRRDNGGRPRPAKATSPRPAKATPRRPAKAGSPQPEAAPPAETPQAEAAAQAAAASTQPAEQPAPADRTGAEPAEADRTGAELADPDRTGAEPAEADWTGAEPADVGLIGTEPAEADRTGAKQAEAGRISAKPGEADRTPPEADRTSAEPVEARVAAMLLHAARDIGRVQTAFDAELLLSTLLGSVYAAALPDRDQAQDAFLATLRAHLAEAEPAQTGVVVRVLAALTGQPSRREQPVAQPGDPVKDKPADQRVDRPADGLTDTPSDGPTGQPTDSATDGPTSGPTGQPTNGPTDQPTSTATDEPTDGRTGRPADQLTGRLVDGPAEGSTEGLAGDPAWLPELGRVRVTGGYAYGDRYGDQTTYITTYAYENPALGGPDHAVAVLVDHNLGIAKDLLVASPASMVLDQLQASVGTDEAAMTWFAEVAPGTVGAAAAAYLRGTDVAPELPGEPGDDSLPANRAVALARLSSLPAPPRPDSAASTRAAGDGPTDAAGDGSTGTGPEPDQAGSDTRTPAPAGSDHDGSARSNGSRPQAASGQEDGAQPQDASGQEHSSRPEGPPGRENGSRQADGSGQDDASGQEQAPGPADTPESAEPSLVAEFLGSPDAQLAGLTDLTGAARESLTYCLGLIVDFGLKRGGDALRWSPRAVELFLLDWVHQRAVLDSDDERVLPDVLGAWVSWSGRRVDLPIPAINETIATARRLRPEFARLCSTGEARSAASRAMAQMIAEGVDPGDPAALDAWLRDHLN